MTVTHLADYLEASAGRSPDLPAFVDPAGWAITYAELDRQADALARHLAHRGVRHGDRVGVVLPPRVSRPWCPCLAPYPIGFACAHCAALVLDHDGQTVAVGGEGLLYISGPSVFRGYWNRPDVNATVFLERDHLRWYNTGDVVRWDPIEGYIYIGRRDRMVKRRGTASSLARSSAHSIFTRVCARRSARRTCRRT